VPPVDCGPATCDVFVACAETVKAVAKTTNADLMRISKV
jgi:hypothetical protein